MINTRSVNSCFILFRFETRVKSRSPSQDSEVISESTGSKIVAKEEVTETSAKEVEMAKTVTDEVASEIKVDEVKAPTFECNLHDITVSDGTNIKNNYEFD